jgi:hypothetical protein
MIREERQEYEEIKEYEDFTPKKLLQSSSS